MYMADTPHEETKLFFKFSHKYYSRKSIINSNFYVHIKDVFLHQENLESNVRLGDFKAATVIP